MKRRLVRIARTMKEGDSITLDAPLAPANREHFDAIMAANEVLGPKGLTLVTEVEGSMKGRKWWAERAGVDCKAT